MLSFSQCDIFPQLLHNWLYNNVYSISSTYTYDIVYNYTTQYTDFAVYICFLYTMWHFSQLLHKWLYNNVYSISATYTYSTVYNYSPQYTGFAVYICFLYTMWHFFTITAQLTLQQCLQHILNIYMRYCLQLHSPVCWLFSLHMLSFYNVNIFPQLLYNCLFQYVYSEATLDTYSTVYNYSPQYTVCAVYISFLFTIWYFFTITAQLTLQQCLQHIRSIYI